MLFFKKHAYKKAVKTEIHLVCISRTKSKCLYLLQCYALKRISFDTPGFMTQYILNIQELDRGLTF